MKGATDTVNNSGIADVALALRTMHAGWSTIFESRFREIYPLLDQKPIQVITLNGGRAYDSAKQALGFYGSLFWREMRIEEEISIKAS